MYTPYEWKTGEVITAEKLNKLEQGVVAASSNPILKIEAEEVAEIGQPISYRLITSVNDIASALKNGDYPILVIGDVVYHPAQIISTDESFDIMFNNTYINIVEDMTPKRIGVGYDTFRVTNEGIEQVASSLTNTVSFDVPTT